MKDCGTEASDCLKGRNRVSMGWVSCQIVFSYFHTNETPPPWSSTPLSMFIGTSLSVIGESRCTRCTGKGMDWK